MSATQTLQGGARAPRSNTLSNLGRILGAVGTVLFISAPLTWMLTGEFGPIFFGKLVIGAACVAAYLATNASFFASVAGARSTGLLAMSATSIVLVLALVALANFVAYKNPHEIDLTREGLYTLSEQTKTLLGRLKSDVKALAFYTNFDPAYPEVKDTLERYATHGSRFSYDIIDPQSRPDLVEQYQITERGPRIVLTAGPQEARAKDVSEQELTNAIVRVAEQTSKKIYFLTGHGEADLEDAENPEGLKGLHDAIGAEGYGVETLSLLTGATAPAVGEKVALTPTGAAKDQASDGLRIPEDAAVLIVAGPRSPLMAPEVDAISAYLDRGGRLIALLDPQVDSGLTALLASWKIEVQDNIIVDVNPLNRLLGLGPAAPMVQPTETQHVITADLAEAGVMMMARSLAVSAGGLPRVDAQTLLGVGSTAWGETNLGKDGTAERDDADLKGPLDVAIVATRAPEGHDDEHGHQDEGSKNEGRVIAFGDSDWVSNKYLSMQGNTDIVLNAINWMAAQEEKITIRPKMRQASQLFLSGEQLGRLKFFSMDFLPVMLIAFGLGIVLIRRQK